MPVVYNWAAPTAGTQLRVAERAPGAESIRSQLQTLILPVGLILKKKDR